MSFKICAVGDVAAFRESPEEMFDYVDDVLQNAEITVGQNERHYTDEEGIQSEPGFTEITSTQNAGALQNGGFDVLTFASNHSMDAGPEIMLETVDVLTNLGIEVIGVGENEAEAREPSIITQDDTKVGFLSYCSVLRDGHEATPNEPGTAPMRAWTHYHQIDYQPGTPPQIKTFPNRNDLEKLVDDISKLRKQVDVLVTCLHWGIHFETATIAEYQKEVAHKAIDAGADMIIGTHPHLLKGIEVYDGKPILYSLGNFAFDNSREELEQWEEQSKEYRVILDLYDWDLTEGSEKVAFPLECRKSLIAEIKIDDGYISEVALLPVKINDEAQPQIMKTGTKGFEEVHRYLDDITREEGLNTKYESKDGKLIVELD